MKKIVEKINRYNFSSSTPRIMGQLESPQVAIDMVKNCKPGTFEASSARLTIDPNTVNENVGVLKGVPVDAEDEAIVTDFEMPTLEPRQKS